MKSTTFKRCLNMTLALSIAFPASLAYADSSTAVSYDETVSLLVRAANSQTPNEAKDLIALARTRIASEQLPTESRTKLNSLLSQVEFEIEHSSPQRSKTDRFSAPAADRYAPPMIAASAMATPDRSSQPNPTVANQNSPELAELQKLFADNPALKSTIQELGRGRVTAELLAMPQKMKTVIDAQNKADLDFNAAMNTPGWPLSWLRSVGALESNAAELNKNLRTEFPNLTTDELADRIIDEASNASTFTGVSRQLPKLMKGNVLGKVGEHGGNISEVLLSFVVNANMILRLTDLYGLKVSDATQNSLIITYYGIAKLIGPLGAKSEAIQSIAKGFGKKFAEALTTRSPKKLLDLYTGFMKAPAVSKVMTTSPLAAIYKSNLRDLEIKSLQLQGRPVPIAPKANFAKPTAPAATAEVKAQPRFPRLSAALSKAWGFTKKVGSKIAFPAKVAASAYLSRAETQAFGYVAKLLLTSTQVSRRTSMNSAVATALYSNETGLGFTKLLILAMNTGPKVPVVSDPAKSTDDKVKFIMNLTRSQAVCSPSEKAQYKNLVKQGTATVFQKAKTYAGFTDEQYSLLKYACSSNLNSSRYNRTVQEFTTLNAIPQDLISGLIANPYTTRLALAEMVLQFLYLDGELDVDKELPFFKDVVLKTLGLNTPDGLSYFKQLDGFLHIRGGLEKNRLSPTGFAIRSSTVDNPFDLSVGYQITGGPTAPAREAGSTTASD